MQGENSTVRDLRACSTSQIIVHRKKQKNAYNIVHLLGRIESVKICYDFCVQSTKWCY